jgi:hypothetical protein
MQYLKALFCSACASSSICNALSIKETQTKGGVIIAALYPTQA